MDWRLIFLSIVVFLLTYIAPISYSGADPKFTLLVSQSILENGTIQLDSYQDDLLLGSPFQRHLADDVIREYDNHYYNYFPLGPSILTLPIVGATSALGYDMRLVSDNFLIQRILASITSVAMVWIVYRIARAYLPAAPSLVITALSVLGSGLVSTMGTALWSINFSVVFIGLSLLIIVRYDTGVSKTIHPILLGSLLFLCFFSRASSAAFIIATFVYLVIKGRRQFLKTAAVALTLLLLFIVWSRFEYGTWLPAYFSTSRLEVEREPIWIAIYGHLFSASRGIFVFSPFLLLVIPGFLLTWRKIIRRPIVQLCLIWMLVLLYLSSRAVVWWGGFSFGPRLLTELILAFSLLIALIWRDVSETLRPEFQKVLAALFLFLGAIAIWINSYQGLYNVNTMGWNVVAEMASRPPLSVLGDTFDWGFPQFLATNEGVCRFSEERHRLLFEYDTTLEAYEMGRLIWYYGDSALDFQKEAYANAASMAKSSEEAIDYHLEEPVTARGIPAVFLPLIQIDANNGIFIGWAKSQEEQEYIWSACKTAFIVFRLSDEVPANSSYTVALTAGANGQQRSHVSLNGESIGEWTFTSSATESETAVFHFSGEILRPNDFNTIAIEIPDANRVNPSEWMLFGLALRHLTIYPGDMPPPLPLPTLPPTSYP